RLRKPPLVLVDYRQVIQQRRDHEVFAAESLGRDRQRPPQQRLGLAIAALMAVGLCLISQGGDTPPPPLKTDLPRCGCAGHGGWPLCLIVARSRAYAGLSPDRTPASRCGWR